MIFISGMSKPGTGSSMSEQDDQLSFGDYWYQGEAELNRYDLKQFRYGEMRGGDAVLIFVTEDFLTDKQVKYEYGPKPESAATVLKMNATRKFITGIYP